MLHRAIAGLQIIATGSRICGSAVTAEATRQYDEGLSAEQQMGRLLVKKVTATYRASS
jgi:hypothetical protein